MWTSKEGPQCAFEVSFDVHFEVPSSAGRFKMASPVGL